MSASYPSHRQRGAAGRLAAAGLVLVCLLPACRRSEAPKPPAARVPVSVAAVSRKAVPVEIPAIGTVMPYATVGIKSRIEGVLQEVFFREGQDVAGGDLLFRIDPRPLEAHLRQRALLPRSSPRNDA